MGRKRSYWLHERSQTYYTTQNGRKVKLGTKDDPIELVEARFNELLKISAKDRLPTVTVPANAPVELYWSRDIGRASATPPFRPGVGESPTSRQSQTDRWEVP